MGKRLLLSLIVWLSPLPALPQTPSAPIQTAQADQKPAAVEEKVVLPETGEVPTGLLVGVGVAVALAILAAGITVSCDDSGGCGALPPITTTTGTR